MQDLKRTKVGNLTISSSKTLDEIEDIWKNNLIDTILIEVDEVFPHYDSITVSKEYSKILYNGNYIFPNNIIDFISDREYDKVKVYDWKNKFKAIYQYNKATEAFKPFKMFL